MDKIDSKLKAEAEISELLYHAEISKQLINLYYKMFHIYIEQIERGQIDFGNELDVLPDSVRNNVNKCIEYCKCLRKQYKEDKINLETGWDLWIKYILKITKSFLTELADKQCEKFKEYQDNRG